MIDYSHPDTFVRAAQAGNRRLAVDEFRSYVSELMDMAESDVRYRQVCLPLL